MADFACMHVWLLQEYGDRVMIPVTSMIEVIHHMVFGELWLYMGRLHLSRSSRVKLLTAPRCRDPQTVLLPSRIS